MPFQITIFKRHCSYCNFYEGADIVT